MCPSLVSRPKKVGTPRLSLALRERVVSFESAALSVTMIWTVSTSPTRRARWSRKKPFAPERVGAGARHGLGRGHRQRDRLRRRAVGGGADRRQLGLAADILEP